MKTLIVPLVASAVAITLFTAPVFAQSTGQDRLDTSQSWQQEFKSRKAQRRANRKANRQSRIKQTRANRKARRDGGSVASAGGTGSGSINDALSGYDLPDYLGGYNQPPNNGAGSITQTLNGYDLPDYLGGYNQPMQDGTGSIAEAIGDVDFTK